MDHDLKSLQTFIQTRFDAIDRRQDDTLQLIATTTTETKSDLDELKTYVQTTNGRLRKAETVIAVLKFAVFTIGGALLLAMLQVAVTRLAQ